MSEFIITIEQIEDLVMQSSAEAIDAYKFGVVKWNWQYPLLPEIVRCKDCYFADEIEGGYWCDRFDCGKEHVSSNGFCAWGEKK